MSKNKNLLADREQWVSLEAVLAMMRKDAEEGKKSLQAQLKERDNRLQAILNAAITGSHQMRPYMALEAIIGIATQPIKP